MRGSPPYAGQPCRGRDGETVGRGAGEGRRVAMTPAGRPAMYLWAMLTQVPADLAGPGHGSGLRLAAPWAEACRRRLRSGAHSLG